MLARYLSAASLSTLLLLTACGGGDTTPPPPPPPPAKITITQEGLATPVHQASKYLLYLPPEYGQEPTRKWPLMVYLHGSQPFSNLKIDTFSQEGIIGYMNKTGTELPAIVIQPQQDVNISTHSIDWHDPVFIDTVIREVETKYSVDKTRVSLAGISLGGFGAWSLALAYPNRFSAVMPIVGGLSNDTDSIDQRLPITNQADWGTVFNRLQSVPFRVYAGTLDQNVPIAWERNPANILKTVENNQLDYRELNSDHFGPQIVAMSAEPINWMLSKTRPNADENTSPMTASDYTGNYHYAAGGSVVVSEQSGSLVLNFSDSRKPLPFLPISEDRFMGPWMMKALRDGQGQVKCLVTPIIQLNKQKVAALIKDGSAESCL